VTYDSPLTFLIPLKSREKRKQGGNRKKKRTERVNKRGGETIILRTIPSGGESSRGRFLEKKISWVSLKKGN